MGELKRKRQQQGEIRGEEGDYDSLELKLYRDPWVVKKKLTKSDLSHLLSRVILPGNQVEKYVLPFLDDNEREKVLKDEKDGEGGLLVRVKDVDKGTCHFLSFKKWKSSGSYKLGRNWIRDFLERRNLGRNDEIGMFWDNSTTGYPTRGFCFSVIKKSPPSDASSLRIHTETPPSMPDDHP